ncbi:hypothetical protein EC968_004650 [Mortierella alpina]|nr:hypothetical protein EC968_004650 [Mortierella alpina]
MLVKERPPPPSKTNTRFSYHGDSTASPTSTSSSSASMLSRSSEMVRQRRTHQSGNLESSSFDPTRAQPPREGASHLHRRSLSTASTTRAATTSETAVLKEKEFMANTRILAMSNLIESFTTSHSRQGFYGKQLKIIGSSTSSTSVVASGAELELTVKEDRDGSWIQATAEKMESPSSSPVSEPRPRRPLSTFSTSSFTERSATPKTHVAVLSNALCFVANKAGDYLVHLSIHVPFMADSGSRSIHLSQIPKCRTNFIKFTVHSADTRPELNEGTDREERSEASVGQDRQGAATDMHDKRVEFNVHPRVMPLDDAHLNPESDEDAQFWLEAQEHLVGREEFVERLVGDEKPDNLTEALEDVSQGSNDSKVSNGLEIAGCFAPASSLHVSWMPRDVTGFVRDVKQDLTIRIMGLPDQTKSSSLLQDRRRKDPEESHAVDNNDPEEEPIEYEHLEMEDSDLVIAVENNLTVDVQKLGWKQPFMDFTITRSDTESGQASDISSLVITGDSIQHWETRHSVSQMEKGNVLREAGADFCNGKEIPLVYRVWFFPGTEGVTVVNVTFRMGQAVSVGYGKDIDCHTPKITILEATEDRGRIRVHTSNNLVVQRCNTRSLETIPCENHSLLEDSSTSGQQPVLHFQYQSPAYQLSVVAQRYQALARIARIERIHVEVGVSAKQQPGFARVVLSNIVLPQQDDSYLRVYQLDGAEIWSVLVDGKPCSKSIQTKDRRSTAQRTVLIPIPEDALNDDDSDNTHHVEISYGFNTVDHELEEELGDDTLSSAIKLVVPGFSLPVGEYLVVASLPKLAKDMDYDEPTGDFEVVSSQGLPGQRRTVTYGAYMTLGRPKLSIRTLRREVEVRGARALDTVAEEAVERGSTEILEQITRTHGHGSTVAHDPQQPPFSPGPVVVQSASQRHPQQPLEPQNPQAEPTLDGEILPVLGTRNLVVQGGATPTLHQGSNLSPQVGSPASLGSANGRVFRDQDAFSLKPLTMEHAQHLVRLWWKQVMAPIVALLLVIMIINVAAFQETRTTSLDLVRVPIWRRSFASISQLWRGPRTLKTTDYGGTESDEANKANGANEGETTFSKEKVAFVGPETLVTVTVPETSRAAVARDLEMRTTPSMSKFGDDAPFVTGKDQGYGAGERQEAGGLMKWIRLLKDMVRGLQPT